MSWLDKEKKKADEAQAKKDKEAAEHKAMWERFHKEECQRASREYKEKFADLEGKMCWQKIDANNRKKLGKFHAELKNSEITFFAGETKMGYIRFFTTESSEYDNDGCSWPSGEYHDDSVMYFYLPYTTANGEEIKVQTPKYGPSYSRDTKFYPEYLAEYLLNFISP